MSGELKIIASDFDGTITYNSEKMLDINIKAIERWRKAGNLFGIVTGRGAESICAELKRRGIDCDFILANNGSLCLFEGKVLFEEKINSSIGAALLETVYSFGCDSLGFDIGTALHGQLYDDDAEAVVSEFLKNEYFTQFNTVCPGETQEHAEKNAHILSGIIAEKHGGILNPLPNGRCIDICRVGCDKGTGIAKLAAKLGVGHENIFTVGDNFNDLAMLDRFESFAMNNACDEVKGHASNGSTVSVASMIEKLL